MQEIYESVIKQAPYAESGAMPRLRLAVHYLKTSENEKALTMLREIIRTFPDTEAARFAMLELGNALSEMSLTGDGDGKYYDEAISVLQDFRKKYPDLSENEWVTQCENNVRAAYADRLYKVAEFYHSEGRDDPAIIYLLDVLRRFPDTHAAEASERLLTKLDKTYFPEEIRPTIPPNYPRYETLKFPKEQRKLMIAPSASDGKFLLPVYDLNLNKEKK
jgi:outer membrane protein assembly factor BamD (BamD/ComL family)